MGSKVFTLEVYGNLVGMFELNNLAMVVSSPVTHFFDHIHHLPENEKEVAERITRPLYDALGEEGVNDYCEGTSFYAFQSCVNHSCEPNAAAIKGDTDVDGSAIILAERHIAIGDEITIAYVSEHMSKSERVDALADYGFVCECRKCCLE